MRTWLGNRRKELGWTKSKAAETLGISRQFYGQIESGERNPTLALAKRICNVMKLDPVMFFVDDIHDQHNQIHSA
ncbi:helix-turn-helix transcriptional regulator [Alicyclobacillus fastidiosus]|uniref:Helix-turn-helix transcriptional regulator n=1 Tax=Alicyclobacillus fastidiosus TaxID=392011 RepID=A0ABV5ALY5_9BACL|nr:helix-turn-helix transcriptional regulator [Alicyclobacillus fastidiosus]WEH08515.1 helix-turn-helix transcriptional regulator [Alicyclobacillus fastidiosus]